MDSLERIQNQVIRIMLMCTKDIVYSDAYLLDFPTMKDMNVLSFESVLTHIFHCIGRLVGKRETNFKMLKILDAPSGGYYSIGVFT